MKVLLLHEFSGVHTELKKGLRRLGVEADIATFGDYHKGFSTDIRLGSAEPGWTAAVERAARQLLLVPSYRSYDIIQSISPTPFNKAVTKAVEHLLFRSEGPRYVYVSAGSDTFYRRYIQTLDYWPPHEWHRHPRLEKLESRILGHADRVVSALWDYDYTMRMAGADPVFIPLPVSSEEIEPVEVGAKERLIVYHPLNREEGNDFKGTSHIREAFAMLRDEFAGQVDFVEKGRMSIHEYMEFTKSVDVVVDQANSYTYGMSGLFALARGQVVLSGNEPASHALGPYAQSPVVNIRPDSTQIADTLRRLLRDRAELGRIARLGPGYVRRHHSSDGVARRYLDLYEEVLNERGSSAPSVQRSRR